MALDILCVDDDPVTLTVLTARYSSNPRWHFRGAKSAAEGLRLLEQRSSHVVISDLEMPEMNGLEFMKEIAQKYPLTRTIILTGHTSITTMLGALQDGAFSFVSKPLGNFAALDKTLDLAEQLICGWKDELERLRSLGQHQALEAIRKPQAGVAP